jgi:ribosomal-protein-alanine N-acetyltransferase
MTTAPQPVDPKYLSLLWAGPDRAAEIAALHEKLFDPPWDAATVRPLLDHPGSTAFVALLGQPKATVGFVLGQIAADEAEILSIGVAPEWQRRGLGRRLVEGLARAVARAEVKRLILEVADDNAAAHALYRGLGFTEVGRRRNYYHRTSGSPVDALLLALAL